MASVRLVCPHCLQRDRLAITSPLLTFSQFGGRGLWLRDVQFGEFQTEAVCGLTCHLCGGWAIGLFGADGVPGISTLNNGSGDATPIEGNPDVQFLAQFPAPSTPTVPPSVPEAAAQFFVEASEDLLADRNPAGVISKCRSVLDLCLKALKAKGTGRKARISDLREKGLLTEGLAHWAGKLWDDGNEAIHDLSGDAERARQHVAFLRLFLEVAFGIPAQVEAAQSLDETATA